MFAALLNFYFIGVSCGMVKVFVTGATGLVGGELALVLANEGFDVYCLIRAATPKKPKIVWIKDWLRAICFRGNQLQLCMVIYIRQI